MSGRHWIKQRAGGLVLSLCALLATGGCGNTEVIVHGRTFLPTGSMRVAGLQPACGCVSLKNDSDQRIMLESTFFGIARGSVFLDPDEQTRVLFDWAGEDNETFYLLDAYSVDGEDRRGAKLKMSDVVSEYAPFVQNRCDDEACTFNGLAMNRMMDDHEELERETATRGVEFTSVITASAPMNECGCMMLTNFTDHDLTLRATLHGTETGQMDMRSGTTVGVVFDWAGSLDSDTYVIDAVDVRTPGDAPLAANNSPKAPATADSPTDRPGAAMTIRLKDHVKIDGTLVNMSCQPEYAEFINHRNTPEQESTVRCPWIPQGHTGLGMRVAYDKRSQQARTDAAAKQAPKPVK